MDHVADTFGRIDYAVNCAGILGQAQRSTETTTETFDHINTVNYRGSFLCSRAELKHMLRQDPLSSHDPDRTPQRGSIVNVASQLGIVGRPSARKCIFSSVEEPRTNCDSRILCLQSCYHSHDPIRRDRLLEGQYSSELCLSRRDRDAHDHVQRGGPRTVEACRGYCSDEANGEADRSC